MTGKIKWFNETKGYGFIAGDDGTDAFVHITQIENNVYPEAGQAVCYATQETPKGIQAVNVTFMNEE